MTNKAKGILTSYLIGTPIGILTILFVYFLPAILTGESMIYIVINSMFLNATIGLIIFFLFALWFAGKSIAKDQTNYSLIKSSFIYSIRVNLISFSSFILISIIDDKLHFEDNPVNELYGLGLEIFLIPPIILFILSTLISTFTIGLIICFVVKKLNTTQG